MFLYSWRGSQQRTDVGDGGAGGGDFKVRRRLVEPAGELFRLMVRQGLQLAVEDVLADCVAKRREAAMRLTGGHQQFLDDEAGCGCPVLVSDGGEVSARRDECLNGF